MSSEKIGDKPINYDLENLKLETKLEPHEIHQALIDYCQKNSNELDIIVPGSEIKQIPVLGTEFKEVDEDIEYVLNMILLKANSFLHNPIFTDSFHKDHDSRREWESSDKFKQMPTQLQEYYESNRLNLNLLSLPFTFILYMDHLDEGGLLNENLSQEIKSFDSKLKELCPKRLNDYSQLNDQDKLAVVNQFKEVFENMVELLTKK